MCNNFCLNCNREEVTRRIKGADIAKDSFNARFRDWKAEKLSKDPKANTTLQQFKKDNKAPWKSNKGKEGTPLTEKEYFDWLENNQELYEIPVPEEFFH